MLALLDSPTTISLDQKVEDKLKHLGRVIAAVNKDGTRFRSHRHVLGLAKASALRRKHDTVEEDDVNLIRALSVLWISPFTGDEPSFRIILELPKTSSQLVDSISPYYSRPTVYRRIQRLAQLKAIKEERGVWLANI